MLLSDAKESREAAAQVDRCITKQVVGGMIDKIGTVS